MDRIRVGIGITTFNRASHLARLLDALAALTIRPAAFFVADDGSGDGTQALLAERAVPHLCASNRGIAWNKNRALSYLHTIERCDVTILIEDDTFPTARGWEEVWVQGALRWGHVNLWPDFWDAQPYEGDGSAASPFVSPLITGQVCAYSKAALDIVGFMDTRFRRYGFEHVEHTRRMIAAGFGGVVDAAHLELRPLLVRGALEVTERDKPMDTDALAENKAIYDRLRAEPGFRPAYRTDEEMAILRAELAGAVCLPSPASRSSVPEAPDWQCRAEGGFALRFDPAPDGLSGGLVCRGDVPGLPRVALNVCGRAVRLRHVGRGDGQGAWLALAAAERFVPVAERAQATVFTFVSAPGAGFGLALGGVFLCCDRNLGGRVTVSRGTLDAWEIFRFDGYRLETGLPPTPAIAQG